MTTSVTQRLLDKEVEFIKYQSKDLGNSPMINSNTILQGRAEMVDDLKVVRNNFAYFPGKVC